MSNLNERQFGAQQSSAPDGYFSPSVAARMEPKKFRDPNRPETNGARITRERGGK